MQSGDVQEQESASPIGRVEQPRDRQPHLVFRGARLGHAQRRVPPALLEQARQHRSERAHLVEEADAADADRAIPGILETASEAAMLTGARAVMRFESSEAAEPILRRPSSLPAGYGPTAAALLEETLAQGVILELVRRGGAKQRAHLAEGTVKEGRLWERHP